MTALIKALTLASCGTHSPVALLAERGYFPSVYRWLGFRYTPYSLSSGAALQLYDFCAGERALEPDARMLAYMEEHVPSPLTKHLVEQSDVIVLDLSTPIEPLLGDAVVNLNRIGDSIVAPLRQSSAPRKLVSDWLAALVGARDDIEVTANALIRAWPDELADDMQMRDWVRRLRSRRIGIEDMMSDIGQLLERLSRPIVMRLFDFRFMPDGRAIDWPTGFKGEQREVARRLGATTLDFAPIVTRFGPGRSVVDDTSYNHFRLETHALQAELIYDAVADLQGLPPLGSDPEWRAARAELFASFPEISGLPAREAFPQATEFLAPLRATSRTRLNRMRQPQAFGSAAAINRVLLETHHARFEALGQQESGLFQHYARLLAEGALVGPRDRAAAMLAQSYHDDYDGYAIMRAGLGELAFILAAGGRPVVAYEPHGLRRAAIMAGREALADAGLIDPEDVRIATSLTPTTPLVGRWLGVGLDVAHVYLEAEAAKHLSGVVEFEALLIEPRLFLMRRETAEAQAALLAQLRELGFVRRMDYPGHSMIWLGREIS